MASNSARVVPELGTVEERLAPLQLRQYVRFRGLGEPV